MRPMQITARKLLVPLAVLALALVLAACGGGGDDDRPEGRLTDPRMVPTATPWPQPPDPIVLDPDALTPVSDTDGEAPDGDDGDGADDGTGTTPTPGVCGDTYIVEPGDTPFGIAAKCGISAEDTRAWVDELLALNDADATSLRVGQVLQIPR